MATKQAFVPIIRRSGILRPFLRRPNNIATKLTDSIYPNHTVCPPAQLLIITQRSRHLTTKVPTMEILSPQNPLKNLTPKSHAEATTANGDTSSFAEYTIHHDEIELFESHLENDVRLVTLPSIIGEEFEKLFRLFPNIEEFDPNNIVPEIIEKYSEISAHILIHLFKKHSPETLSLLQQMENEYKGLSETKAPHTVFRNLNIGTVTTTPSSDKPIEDPEYYKAQAPYLSELLSLGMARLQRFQHYYVPDEKGGVDVHHHVPVKGKENSGTSISRLVDVKFHTEDVHEEKNPHIMFMLYGKLGNPESITPLLSLRSLISIIPEEKRERIMEGMKLHFIFEPGAGREDGTPERLIAPMIDTDATGKTFVRFNAANYFNIKTGEHIARQRLLPREFYESEEQYELAKETIKELMQIFENGSEITKSSGHTFNYSVETGALTQISNSVGPHARTPFNGSRYLQRTYLNCSPRRFFKHELMCKTLEEKEVKLSTKLQKQLSTDQKEFLKRVEMPLMDASSSGVSKTLHQTLSRLGELTEYAYNIRYATKNPHHLREAKHKIQKLREPLLELNELLTDLR